MYLPKYIITTDILRNIGLIEAAKEVVDNAPLVPAWEKKFQNEATLRAVHYGTAMEGNDLTLGEAKIILEKEIESVKDAASEGVVARDRDVQEVINYRNVLDFLEEETTRRKSLNEKNDYSIELVHKIHSLVIDRVIPKEHYGKLREVQVVLKNSETGEVGFRPPQALDVPFLLSDFFKWLNSDYGRKEHPVLRAGIAHYVLAAIHPYVEGNGRTSRAFATLVMFCEGYDVKKLFALEEYFDKNANEYYGSLMDVSNQSQLLSERDLTPWLSVFTRALAVELTRIKEQIRELSVDIGMKKKMGRQVSLSERQIKLVEYLQAHGELSMAEAREVLPMVSEDTILRDFKYLMEREVVRKSGSTKAARYVLNT